MVTVVSTDSSHVPSVLKSWTSYSSRGPSYFNCAVSTNSSRVPRVLKSWTQHSSRGPSCIAVELSIVGPYLRMEESVRMWSQSVSRDLVYVRTQY